MRNGGYRRGRPIEEKGGDRGGEGNTGSGQGGFDIPRLM